MRRAILMLSVLGVLASATVVGLFFAIPSSYGNPIAAILIGLAVILTVALSIATSLTACVHASLRRQPGWSWVFGALTLLSFLSPLAVLSLFRSSDVTLALILQLIPVVVWVSALIYSRLPISRPAQPRFARPLRRIS